VFIGNAPGFILSIWFNLVTSKLQYQDYAQKHIRTSIVDILHKDQSLIKANDIFPEDKDENLQENSSSFLKSDFIANLENELLLATIPKTDIPAPHEKVVMGIIVIWVIIISLVSLLPISHTTMELTIGFAVNFNLLFFYGGPLSTLFEVIKTKNSESIHRWTMLTNTANGIFWGLYGLGVKDPFISLPNLLGASLGVIQMFLVSAYPRKTEVLKEPEDPTINDP